MTKKTGKKIEVELPAELKARQGGVKKKQFGAYINIEVHDRLKTFCHDNKISMNAVVEYVVLRFLNEMTGA